MCNLTDYPNLAYSAPKRLDLAGREVEDLTADLVGFRLEAREGSALETWGPAAAGVDEFGVGFVFFGVDAADRSQR